jgi:hypothetical protein
MIGPSDRKTAWKGKGTRMASFWLGWWGEGRMRMASDHPLVWRSRLIVVRFPRRSSRRLTPAIPAPAHPEKRETTTTSGTRTGTTRKIKEQKRAADLRVFYVAISAALSRCVSKSGFQSESRPTHCASTTGVASAGPGMGVGTATTVSMYQNGD